MGIFIKNLGFKLIIGFYITRGGYGMGRDLIPENHRSENFGIPGFLRG